MGGHLEHCAIVARRGSCDARLGSVIIFPDEGELASCTRIGAIVFELSCTEWLVDLLNDCLLGGMGLG